jgi:hypothetical protein
MSVLARDWVECIAAVMLSATAAFSFLNASYGTAVIAGTCAGLVAGMQFAKWVYRERS